MFSPLIQQLILALRALPGVGPKSAQRIALHLLEHKRKEALTLAKVLEETVQKIGRCKRCRTFSETPLCNLCNNPNRETKQLCVVENPTDILAIEQTGTYKGYYFVLMGKLSPLDGIGPKELGIDQLLERATQEPIEELILATNPTVEGEATAHYIKEQLKTLPILLSRIAYGVPVGGELEYLDGGTLMHALTARIFLKKNEQ